ncbi:hypothetical protein E3U43_004442, partial [Larimichthys crocea]
IRGSDGQRQSQPRAEVMREAPHLDGRQSSVCLINGVERQLPVLKPCCLAQ